MKPLMRFTIIALTALLLFGCNKHPEQQKLVDKLEFLSIKVHEIEKQSQKFNYMQFYHQRKEATDREVFLSSQETQEKIAELIESIRQENIKKIDSFEDVEIQKEFYNATNYLINGYEQRRQIISYVGQVYDTKLSALSFNKMKAQAMNEEHIYNIAKAKSGYIKVKEGLGIDTTGDEFDGLLDKE